MKILIPPPPLEGGEGLASDVTPCALHLTPYTLLFRLLQALLLPLQSYNGQKPSTLLLPG